MVKVLVVMVDHLVRGLRVVDRVALVDFLQALLARGLVDRLRVADRVALVDHLRVLLVQDRVGHQRVSAQVPMDPTHPLEMVPRQVTDQVETLLLMHLVKRRVRVDNRDGVPQVVARPAVDRAALKVGVKVLNLAQVTRSLNLFVDANISWIIAIVMD